jgi:hypothetical protein
MKMRVFTTKIDTDKFDFTQLNIEFAYLTSVSTSSASDKSKQPSFEASFKRNKPIRMERIVLISLIMGKSIR